MAARATRTPSQLIRVVGDDLFGPLSCLEAFKPELTACNARSLNYLKIRKDGAWAWPPILFDNPVEKVQRFLDVMTANKIIPEFECFDSGMPANPDLLPILKDELPQNAHWQVIATGPKREKIWNLHRRCLELGGDVRTGLEDTFYLPNGDRTQENGQLVEALVKIVHEVGKAVASPAEACQSLGIKR